VEIASNPQFATAYPEKPWFHGEPLRSEVFWDIHARAVIRGCKWDPQVGDTATLANFPLILTARAWDELSRFSEAMTAELFTAERNILSNRELLARLGLPSRISRLLYSHQDHLTESAARIMRFDFHYTDEGWKISEVNSDVPGGFSEASFFTTLMASHYPKATRVGNPARVLAEALTKTGATLPHIALLSATGFMEDQQITAFLAGELRSLGCAAYLRRPSDLRWNDCAASVTGEFGERRLGAIVRFYQAEWLPKLRSRTDWEYLIARGKTPVSNPGIAAISESKRLALLLADVKAPTLSQLLPETRDPRDADWPSGDGWVLKAAMSNNGDTVCIKSEMNAHTWSRISREILRKPELWAAQRRFRSKPMDSPAGPIFPCIGVYTVNGQVAGAYGRYSHKHVIDYSAVDVPVLVARQETPIGIRHER
jgi:glutathionylspermidine synthase